MATSGSEWLLVAASTGKEAALRVFVWRQLRKLGAVHVGPSVCLLPRLPHIQEAVDQLAARVDQQGGRARVFTVCFTQPDEEQALRADQQAERDAEYAE